MIGRMVKLSIYLGGPGLVSPSRGARFGSPSRVPEGPSSGPFERLASLHLDALIDEI